MYVLTQQCSGLLLLLLQLLLLLLIGLQKVTSYQTFAAPYDRSAVQCCPIIRRCRYDAAEPPNTAENDF